MLTRSFFSVYVLALAGVLHLDLSAGRPLNAAVPEKDMINDGHVPARITFQHQHVMSKRTTGRKAHLKNRRTFSPTTTTQGRGQDTWQLYHRRQVMYHYGQRHLHHQQREFHHRQDDYHRQMLEHHLEMEEYHLAEEGALNSVMSTTEATTTTTSTTTTSTTTTSTTTTSTTTASSKTTTSMPSTRSPSAELPLSLPLLSPTERDRQSSSQLGCETFSCLASNFELLRTDRGYLLTKEQASNDGGAASCKNNLTCWLGHFDVRPTGFGFELVLKSSEKRDDPSAGFHGLQPEHVFQYGEPRNSAATTANYQGDDPSPNKSAGSLEYDYAELFGDPGHQVHDDGVKVSAASEVDYDNIFGFKR